MEIRVLNLKYVVLSLSEHYEGLASHRESLRNMLEVFKREDRQRASERFLNKDPKPKMSTSDGRPCILSDIADMIMVNRTIVARVVSEYGQALDQGEQGFLSFLEYPVMLFKCLQIPVSIFQKLDNYEIHNIHCTRETLFKKQSIRNNWAWIKVATTEPWEPLKDAYRGLYEQYSSYLTVY